MSWESAMVSARRLARQHPGFRYAVRGYRTADGEWLYWATVARIR